MTAQAKKVRSWNDEEVRFDVANRLFFRLYQASNLMHKTGTRVVSEYGTTTQQWAVLGALSRPGTAEEGMTVKELIEFLMVSRQNLTAVLNRMERSGLVERTRTAEDGRFRRVRLTTKGAAIWARMLVNIRAYYEAATADFSTDEGLMLFRLLDRLLTGLGRL
ncbi:MAG: MarR family transcriptional regulator [Hyphomicrobiaceae bacterium]|nr:MarR family transcriptional regulator [Hyphomicrobiaceae bacterium]